MTNKIAACISFTREKMLVTGKSKTSTAPMVFQTFGKFSSVHVPSPPKAGPNEVGAAFKSINTHLITNESK